MIRRIAILASWVALVWFVRLVGAPQGFLAAYARLGCAISSPFTTCTVEGARIVFSSFIGVVTLACTGLLEAMLLFGMIVAFEGVVSRPVLVRAMLVSLTAWGVTLIRIPIVAVLAGSDLSHAVSFHDAWYLAGGLVTILGFYAGYVVYTLRTRKRRFTG